MTIARYVADVLGVPAIASQLEVLEAIGDRRFGSLRFYPSVQQATEMVDAWMPPFVLPIGAATYRIALQLRPDDVAAGRLSLLEANVDFSTFREVGTSIEQVVYRSLLEAEERAEGTIDTKLETAARDANELFGDGFYELGRDLGSTGVEGAMDRAGRAATGDLASLATFADEASDKLAYALRGIELEPASLAMYRRAALALDELGERPRAAELVARSLDCYHYTSDTTMAEYYELAESLARETPAPFARYADDLADPDPRTRLRGAGERWSRGDIVGSEKIVNDVAYDVGPDYGPVTIAALRKHYVALGWRWAVELCDARPT